MSNVDDSRIAVTFENWPQLNEAASKSKGRPIYDDIEVCRIRMSGDRLNSPVFPAHAEAPGGITRADGTIEKATYAQKYNRQYQEFKAGKAQTKEGTPLEELPFLTAAKRNELKALHIYTAEALAALDGQPLKTLGQGGRELKNQAQAYMDKAAGSADITRLASEAAFYKAEAERLQNELNQRGTQAPDDERVTENLGYEQSVPEVVSEFEDWDDNLIKEFIAEKTGQKPKGNPSHETLVKMADELAAEMTADNS